MSNDLAEWSRIIERQGEERRARDNERLERTQAALPERIAELQTLAPVELINSFRHFASVGDSDPRVMVIMRQMADACALELHRRLTCPA